MSRKQNPRRKRENQEKQEQRKLEQTNQFIIDRQKNIESVEHIVLDGEELERMLGWFWYKAKDDQGYFTDLVKDDRRLYNNIISRYGHLLPKRHFDT